LRLALRVSLFGPEVVSTAQEILLANKIGFDDRQWFAFVGTILKQKLAGETVAEALMKKFPSAFMIKAYKNPCPFCQHQLDECAPFKKS
jgi:hypothetical protein